MHVASEDVSAEPTQELRAIAKASRFTSLTEMAFAITNGLKTKFQCDQVILGKVDGGRVRIASMSSFDALYPRSPGCRLIQQAMEECLDSGQRVDVHDTRVIGPTRSPAAISACIGSGGLRLAMRRWRRCRCCATASAWPCSAWCGRAASGFQSGELEEIERARPAYGPALQLVARASRNWFVQTRDTLRDGCRVAVGEEPLGTPSSRRRRSCCWPAGSALGTVNYRISMPCQVVPTRLQHFGAPFEGCWSRRTWSRVTK